MSIAGTSILVTGANRGIGQALVDEALRRGAARVYAGTRQPLTHRDARVTPVVIDVTDPAQVAAAAEKVGALDILVNNAGVSVYDDLGEIEALQQHLAVNLYGTYRVTQAFLPALASAKGSVVNVLSVSAVAALPVLPAYSISKAAALSLSQSTRALLADRGVRVHVVLSGPVDTEMSRGIDVPKASPESVARAIFDGVDDDEDEIFPDAMSAQLADGWRAGAPKALEREFAAYVAAPVAT